MPWGKIVASMMALSPLSDTGATSAVVLSLGTGVITGVSAVRALINDNTYHGKLRLLLLNKRSQN